MELTPIRIDPPTFEAGDIRAFVEMVARVPDLGIVVELEPEAYHGLLIDALRVGAPLELVQALATPDGRGWTVFHHSRSRFNYWRRDERWLLSPDDCDEAGPIWCVESESVLREVGQALEIFLEPDARVAYLFTEEADRRPVPGYPEPRPFLKRRFLYSGGQQMVLHHRLTDGVVDGAPVRTAEYALDEPTIGRCLRFSQTISLATNRLLNSEGPEEVDRVQF